MPRKPNSGRATKDTVQRSSVNKRSKNKSSSTDDSKNNSATRSKNENRKKDQTVISRTSEIDDIFSKKRKNVKSDIDPLLPHQSRTQRKETEKRKRVDGLTLYTEEELKLTSNLTGGGTPLCPFDCNCCF